MDAKVLVLFKKYLAQEVLRGDGIDRKKIMGTKVITISKLLNDLSFWTEVERYSYNGQSQSLEVCSTVHSKLSIINIDSLV